MHNRKIIVKVHGGLGNQLFQYAFARALALRHDVPVALDLQYCQWHRRRPLQLQYFGCCLPAATPKELQSYRRTPMARWRLALIDWMARQALRGGVWRALFRKTLKQTMIEADIDVLRELHVDPDSGHDDIEHGVYFDGYWQDPSYFEPFRDQLRNELQLLVPLSPPAQQLLARIEAEPCPISVHVRRGDYLSSKVAKLFDVVPMEYYLGAIRRFRQTHAKARFVFFSDDMNWVRESLAPHAGDPILSDLQLASHEDLWLMSRCAHHVIANSTFSWWGAWLNPSADRQVIAPQEWARDAQTRKLTGRIIPQDWIRLNTAEVT